jgi:adenosine deaminase
MSDTNIELKHSVIKIVSETNGLSLNNTLELLVRSDEVSKKNKTLIIDFQRMLWRFQGNSETIENLLDHPVADAFFHFFKNFPIPYCEEHIHLTGSLAPNFIWEHLENLLNGKDREIYLKKIREVYGNDKIKIENENDVKNLIQLKPDEEFSQYLKILYLPKLILKNRQIHELSAYHMAQTLFEQYNVGSIRLKFTLSRSTGIESEKIPGLENITEEDVVLGLYTGFMKYKSHNPKFDFTLTPCFRKEGEFFDQVNFKSKREHFGHQVQSILKIIDKYPFLKEKLCEVDTVGDEKNLYKKSHFSEMREGFRKLQYRGFKIKSHHGETWKILRTGVQSVDNAMNIWHIDTLEHGISLGINPNFYFHRIYQHVTEINQSGQTIQKNSLYYRELEDMNWESQLIKDKILNGKPLTLEERKSFLKTKFHTAREIEHYQHDVLNRMINKKVSLVALPSSNLKLTGSFPDFKDHPFSWWEKKGVKLGIGTDNYITLNTNFIKEMLILLLSEPENLKITKLLIIATRESRRPYISHMLWEMRRKIEIATKD